MEDAQKPVNKTWTYCLWVSVAVVVLVFIVPIESVQSGMIERSYTLWDLITQRGPSTTEIHLPH